MEKQLYLLNLNDSLDINLYVHPIITLKGTEKGKFLRSLVKKNMEFSFIILDRDSQIAPVENTEYVFGERKALARLKELAYDEVDRRMQKLAVAGCRNFFEYNLARAGEDYMQPTLVFFISVSIGRTAEKYLKQLSYLAKAVALFLFYCEPEDEKMPFSLYASTSLDITVNKDGSFLTEHFVTVDTPFEI